MFLKSLYSFERHFLVSRRFVLFVLGVSPDISSFKRFAFFLMILIYLLPIYFQIFYQLFMTSFKLELMIRLLQRATMGLCFTCLTAFLYLFVEKRILILAHMKKDYELVTDNEELNILEKYTKESKYYTLLLIGFFKLYVVVVTFPSIFKIILYHLGIFDDVPLTLPLAFDDVFDLKLQYYCLFVYHLTAIYVVFTLDIIILSSYLVMVQHASSLFSIIVLKIRRPFKDNINNEKSLDEWDWMVDIIVRYKRVTEFINLLNTLTEVILFVIVIFLAAVIILNFFYILQLSIEWKNIIDNVEIIVFVFSSMFVVYIFFYVGQKLMDHSTTTFDEIRQLPFYILSIKTQKLFLFLITRSMKPSSLSIGGLYVFSHEVFAALLQKGFYFATVFCSVRS